MALPQVKVVHASEAKAVKRTLRKPQHPFNIHSRPFEITPFLIAPTLPGDTLTNWLMQSRVVTDPILNPLIGWWKEYYFFHVPITALDANFTTSGNGFATANIEGMFIDPTVDLRVDEGGAGAVSAPYYTFKDGMNYVQYAVEVITQWFFRDEDDVATTLLDNYPGAYIDRRNGFQSLLANDATGDDPELPGVDDIEEQEKLSAYSTEYDKWEILRDSALTDLTYEDYLRAQGVGVPAGQETDPDTGKVISKPELLRYVRKWQYPVNHIDPTTGTPTSAVSWSIVERGDAKYLFKQPGFVVGVTVTRPKMYLGSQKGSLTGLMSTWKHWPSVVMKDHPYTKLIKVTHSATDGPLINQATQDYWLDIGDLFEYGEQFVNFAQTVADNHALTFPGDVAGGATLADRVPTLAQSKSFFVDAAGTKNLVREDGVCHLTFKSRLGKDTTPGGG